MHGRAWGGLALIVLIGGGCGTPTVAPEAEPLVEPVPDRSSEVPDPAVTATSPTPDPAPPEPVTRPIGQPPVYSFEQVAIRGADPVAYFTQGAAVRGSGDYEYQWNGATWRFSSAEHRDAFIADPLTYVPQYGGYCAWAVSRGYLASVDPEVWDIVDGRLYLNYSRGVQRQWQRDTLGHIAQGDQNWDGVLASSEVSESGQQW